MSGWPRIVAMPAPREANYTYATYGTARITLNLQSGPVEISHVINTGEFATDREITQVEYDQIRVCLRQMIDCALISSNPRGLVGP